LSNVLIEIKAKSVQHVNTYLIELAIVTTGLQMWRDTFITHGPRPPMLMPCSQIRLGINGPYG
jgi:hypothetical protein